MWPWAVLLCSCSRAGGYAALWASGCNFNKVHRWESKQSSMSTPWPCPGSWHGAEGPITGCPWQTLCQGKQASAALPCWALYPPHACAATAVASAAPWQPRGVLMAHLAEHRRAITRVAVAGGGALFVSASADETCKARACRRWLAALLWQALVQCLSRAKGSGLLHGAAEACTQQITRARHHTTLHVLVLAGVSSRTVHCMETYALQCIAHSLAFLAAMHAVRGALSVPCPSA